MIRKLIRTGRHSNYWMFGFNINIPNGIIVWFGPYTVEILGYWI